jgi:L-asparaginase
LRYDPQLTDLQADPIMSKKRIAIISTGGTIEKTYQELEGVLHNEYNVLDVLLASLMLEGTDCVRIPLMNKDSLQMSDEDHMLIANTAHAMAAAHDGVIVVHGTDKLSVTGEKIYELNNNPAVPIVLTGAMRPYALRHSDSEQNMTESLMAVQILSPGVYVVMHNSVWTFPGVMKDRQRGTFCQITEKSVEPDIR